MDFDTFYCIVMKQLGGQTREDMDNDLPGLEAASDISHLPGTSFDDRTTRDKDVDDEIEDMAVTQLQDPKRSAFNCCYCGISSKSFTRFHDHVNGDLHRKNFASLVEDKRSRQRKEPLMEFKREELGKHSLLEMDLNNFTNEPVIGLSYITEHQSIFGIKCICHLCGIMFSHMRGQDHVTGIKHQMNYVKIKRPDDYEYICRKRTRHGKIAVMYHVLLSIEEDDGRGTPAIQVFEDKSSSEGNSSNSSVDPETVKAFGEFVNQELQAVKEKITDDPLPFDQDPGGEASLSDSEIVELWDFEGERKGFCDGNIADKKQDSNDLGWEFPEEKSSVSGADTTTSHEHKDQATRGATGLGTPKEGNERLLAPDYGNASDADDNASIYSSKPNSRDVSRPSSNVPTLVVNQRPKQKDDKDTIDNEEGSDENKIPKQRGDDKTKSEERKREPRIPVFLFSRHDLGKFSYLKTFLTSHTTEPVLGLSFVTEYQHTTTIRCICHLCGASFPYDYSKTHMTGFKHRLRYLRKKWPQIYADLSTPDKKRNLLNKLQSKIRSVQLSDGRGTPEIYVYEGNEDSKIKALNSQTVSNNPTQDSDAKQSHDEFMDFMRKEHKKDKALEREPVMFEKDWKTDNRLSDPSKTSIVERTRQDKTKVDENRSKRDDHGGSYHNPDCVKRFKYDEDSRDPDSSQKTVVDSGQRTGKKQDSLALLSCNYSSSEKEGTPPPHRPKQSSRSHGTKSRHLQKEYKRRDRSPDSSDGGHHRGRYKSRSPSRRYKRSQSPSSMRDRGRANVKDSVRRGRNNSSPRRHHSRSPAINDSSSRRYKRSRSPAINDSSSRRYKRSRSPAINDSSSRRYKRSRSPEINDSSPRRYKRSRSPAINDSSSRRYKRSRSPEINDSSSRRYKRSRSPEINDSSSRRYKRSRSPEINDSSSRRYKRSRSPEINDSSSRRYKRSRSPEINDSSSRRYKCSRGPEEFRLRTNLKDKDQTSVRGTSSRLSVQEKISSSSREKYRDNSEKISSSLREKYRDDFEKMSSFSKDKYRDGSEKISSSLREKYRDNSEKMSSFLREEYRDDFDKIYSSSREKYRDVTPPERKSYESKNLPVRESRKTKSPERYDLRTKLMVKARAYDWMGVNSTNPEDRAHYSQKTVSGLKDTVFEKNSYRPENSISLQKGSRLVETYSDVSSSDEEISLPSRKKGIPAPRRVEKSSPQREPESDSSSEVDEAQVDRIAEMIMNMKDSMIGRDSDPQRALQAILSLDVNEVLLAANRELEGEEPGPPPISRQRQRNRERCKRYREKKAGLGLR